MVQFWNEKSIIEKIKFLTLSLFISFGLTLSLRPISEETFKAAYVAKDQPILRFFLDIAESAQVGDVTSVLILLGVTALCFFSTSKRVPKTFGVLAMLFAAVLALFSVMGLSFQLDGSWDLVISHHINILLKAFIKWAATTLLLFEVSKLPAIYAFSRQAKDESSTYNKKSSLKLFLLMFLSWGLYLIILYPGTSSWDTLNQISEFFGRDVSWVYPTSHYLLHAGQSSISDHHPFFLTLIYGSLIKIGAFLGHPHLGIFLISVLQCTFIISIFVYSISVFKKLGISQKVTNGIFLFYCFFPLFPIYSIYQVKNSLYGGILLWFCLLLIEAVHDPDKFLSLKWRLWMSVNIFLQIFTIKYGFYVAFISTVILLGFSIKNWKSILLYLAVPILIFKLGYTAISTHLDLIPGDPIEMYSIPLQQTGRYLKQYPNDLSTSEKKVLSKMFVLKDVASNYTPEVSDAMKSGGGSTYVYRYRTVTKKDLKDYQKVWIQLFFRHPGVYFEAFFNQTYAYLNVFQTIPLHAQNLAYDQFPLNSPRHADGQYVFHTANKEFTWNATSRFTFGHNVIISILNILVSMPLISLLFRGTFYVLITLLITLLALSFKRAWKLLPIISPILLQLGICLLSPVNGSQRYLYPFIYCGPFLIIILILALRLIHSENKGE